MVVGMKRQVGIYLILTGLLHTLVGVMIYAPELGGMGREGLWYTVKEGQFDREAAFWFMMFGFMLMWVGYIVDWLIKKKEMVPPVFIGWVLLLICVVGVICMPTSGFWLGLPQAWLLLRQ